MLFQQFAGVKLLQQFAGFKLLLQFAEFKVLQQFAGFKLLQQFAVVKLLLQFARFKLLQEQLAGLQLTVATAAGRASADCCNISLQISNCGNAATGACSKVSAVATEYCGVSTVSTSACELYINC